VNSHKGEKQHVRAVGGSCYVIDGEEGWQSKAKKYIGLVGLLARLE